MLAMIKNIRTFLRMFAFFMIFTLQAGDVGTLLALYFTRRSTRLLDVFFVIFLMFFLVLRIFHRRAPYLGGKGTPPGHFLTPIFSL